jgi:exosome complex component RRP41
VTSEALEKVIITDYYPRAAIDVNIEVLNAEAGTRCAGLTAAGVALADAGIPLKDIPVACAAGKIGAEDNDGSFTGGAVVLDLGKEEDNFGNADLPIAIAPRTNEILLLQMDGHLTMDEFNQALDYAMKGCHDISKVQKEALMKRYTSKGGDE